MLLYFAQVNAEQSEDVSWQLVRDESGVQVYTRKVAGTEIVKARAVTIIRQPMENINHVLEDINNRYLWVPYLKQSRVISKGSGTTRIEYSHFEAPWPASDRDFVYFHNKVHHDDDLIVYKARSTVVDTMPEQSDMVRGEIFYSHYRLESMTENLTQVELVYHADPQGWLPDWIINIIQRALPYRMLLNLQNRLIIIQGESG